MSPSQRREHLGAELEADDACELVGEVYIGRLQEVRHADVEDQERPDAAHAHVLALADRRQKREQRYDDYGLAHQRSQTQLFLLVVVRTHFLNVENHTESISMKMGTPPIVVVTAVPGNRNTFVKLIV
jgi:hypothetical protein